MQVGEARLRVRDAVRLALVASGMSLRLQPREWLGGSDGDRAVTESLRRNAAEFGDDVFSPTTYAVLSGLPLGAGGGRAGFRGGGPLA